MGGVEQFFDKCCSWNSTSVSQCKYYNISFRQPRFLKLFFFKLIFIIVDLQCCIIFLLYNRVNLLYIHIYPLFFRFYSHIGHYRVLSRVPCAVQQVLVVYLFYVCQWISINAKFLIYPPLPFPFRYSLVCFLCLSYYFCFVNKFICFIFLDPTYT